MPQLVFVHGVATRDTQAYKIAVTERDKLFRELLFTGTDVEIHSPMWGSFVSPIPPEVFQTNADIGTFSLNVRSLTGFGGGLMGGVNGAGPDSSLSIVAVGKQDPVAALDAICSEVADRAAREKRPLSAEEFQAFRNASELIASNNAATVFPDNANIQTVTEQLKDGIPATFGIGSVISDAISAVTDRISHAASTLGFGAVRDSISPAVGLFMGDVFVYLKQGKGRDNIRGAIRQALIEAHKEKKAGKGPLVVVGHSMGGG
ncbi:hypothetical protein V2A85_15890 [Yersinia sp. 1252 StPb PI]|uniref:hypothetical protein n=1 Tax=Yersinia sp. 1252 StPb PI TaxID=3117404 RepID=UPI003B287D1F